jgi:predicted nucleotidyltransferase
VTNTSNNSIAMQAVEALREGLHDNLKAVVLFGSRAREDSRSDSDWDLLVVADNLPQGTLARHQLLKRLLPASIRSVVSLVSMSPHTLDIGESGLLFDISEDGRVLYDSTGTTAQKLQLLNRSIHSRGFSRRRSSGGDHWLRT